MPDQLPLLPLILDDVPGGLTSALAQEGVPTLPHKTAATAGRFVLFDSRKTSRPAIDRRQVAVDVDELRHGETSDPLQAPADRRPQMHQWQIAGWTLREEIARVDRRVVRRRVLGRLRRQIEEAGGIWLCLAIFPFPYRSALNFRIDYDQYDPHDFDATLQALAGWEDATSHFVNAATYEHHPDALARLRGLDVGSHGYHHHTYLTEAENLDNVRRGINVLRAAGIEPQGFAAPHGQFNPGLAAALEELRVGHSSEFGLAYDDLPIFHGEGNLLQIPVHPVCLGLFLDAAERDAPDDPAAQARAAADATEYFRKIVQTKYHAGEPVFLYGHPTGRLGRYPDVPRAVFDVADGFGAIWKTTMSRIARWWRARAAVRLRVTRYDEEFVVTVDNLPSDDRVAVEFWRGKHAARMPVRRRVLRFSSSALAYENRDRPCGIRPVQIDQGEGLRGRVRRWIDWERVTPIDEIGKGTLRNWAKRTLRQLKK